TVVQNDGQYVRPVETDEFQIGVAETYDVIVEPKSPAVFPVVAESIDRSGEVVATFAPEAGMRAAAPPLRERPLLTMEDMGMGGMGMPGMDMSGMDMSGMNMPGMQMDHSPPKAGMKQRGSAMPAKDSDNNQMRSGAGKSVRTGVGVDNVVMTPTSRLNDPGLGLENVGHRTLSYSQLRSLAPNPDLRAPEREIEVHLTGNMERYMWSFDGVKFSDAKEPIIFHEGERVRVTLINDTMMTHPIHLHGMFFDLVVDESDYKPRKHTVDVKPAERVSFDVTADHIGDWAFHCHLLYHMHAGMMRVVSILPRGRAA
ncbi:MAG TPA: multicopper oxidase domain-containing protein, partial [Parvularculaceae bacterium]|nr:multicopper oxidase domain-containing protein [Parvularculaceae bacterium]